MTLNLAATTILGALCISTDRRSVTRIARDSAEHCATAGHVEQATLASERTEQAVWDSRLAMLDGTPDGFNLDGSLRSEGSIGETRWAGGDGYWSPEDGTYDNDGEWIDPLAGPGFEPAAVTANARTLDTLGDTHVAEQAVLNAAFDGPIVRSRGYTERYAAAESRWSNFLFLARRIREESAATLCVNFYRIRDYLRGMRDKAITNAIGGAYKWDARTMSYRAGERYLHCQDERIPLTSDQADALEALLVDRSFPHCTACRRVQGSGLCRKHEALGKVRAEYAARVKRLEERYLTPTPVAISGRTHALLFGDYDNE